MLRRRVEGSICSIPDTIELGDDVEVGSENIEQEKEVNEVEEKDFTGVSPKLFFEFYPKINSS